MKSVEKKRIEVALAFNDGSQEISLTQQIMATQTKKSIYIQQP